MKINFIAAELLHDAKKRMFSVSTGVVGRTLVSPVAGQDVSRSGSTSSFVSDAVGHQARTYVRRPRRVTADA